MCEPAPSPALQSITQPCTTASQLLPPPIPPSNAASLQRVLAGRVHQLLILGACHGPGVAHLRAGGGRWRPSALARLRLAAITQQQQRRLTRPAPPPPILTVLSSPRWCRQLVRGRRLGVAEGSSPRKVLSPASAASPSPSAVNDSNCSTRRRSAGKAPIQPASLSA